uniref:Peptidase M24 domain-containing protein n=1 Tax=Leersia perrieri TaxID=77586 RepID=A0A0D9W9A3_9ORYZ
MEVRVPSMELHRSPPFLSGGRGKFFLHKPFLVQAKRLEGLEKANKRSRGTQSSEEVKKRAPLTRGTVSPPLPVPGHITQPPYVGKKDTPEIASEIQMHDKVSIVHMKAACELAARVLEHAGTLVKPSVTTDEIDKAVHKMIIDAGAYPSPLGYGGFPKSVCTSVNECMCHGIPDSRELQVLSEAFIVHCFTLLFRLITPLLHCLCHHHCSFAALQDGDIINIDVTVYLNGYHGDTSKTFLCGEVDDASKRLVRVTEECMLRAISACKHGTSFKKIGRRISEHAERHGFSVVECFVGHGVGRIFHSEPIIYHQRNNGPGQMVEGQTFTIEPILSMGSIECDMWDDGWTAVTTDGSLAAQFEHTILITKTGAEILTKC